MRTPPPIPGPRDVDALRELATIGCGHAVTALAKLAALRLEMDVPEVWVGRGPGAIPEFLGALTREQVAVALRLEGVLSGHLVLLMSEPDGRRLVARLGQPAAPGERWDPLSKSALMETGNIVGSAFVSAIADMIGGRLLPSVPSLARGGARACLQALVEGDAARIALATRVWTTGTDALEGLILVVPDEARIATLLAALDFAYK